MPKSGKFSFYIGRHGGYRVSMKKTFGPLYKIDKSVADPLLNVIPRATVSHTGTTTRIYKLELDSDSLIKANRKYGRRLKIYSVYESPYVNLAPATAVYFYRYY